MKKKLILIFSILFLPYFFFFRKVELIGSYELSANSKTEKIWGRKIVGQIFLSKDKNLCRIDIPISTMGKTNFNQLIFHLVEYNPKVISVIKNEFETKALREVNLVYNNEIFQEFSPKYNIIEGIKIFIEAKMRPIFEVKLYKKDKILRRKVEKIKNKFFKGFYQVYFEKPCKVDFNSKYKISISLISSKGKLKIFKSNSKIIFQPLYIRDLVTIYTDLSKAKYGTFYKFKFPKISDSKGKYYFFYLESIPSSKENGFMVASNSKNEYIYGNAVIDGIIIPADLIFITYHSKIINFFDILKKLSENKPSFLGYSSFYFLLFLIYLLYLSFFIILIIKWK